jgi:uncharacterized protein
MTPDWPALWQTVSNQFQCSLYSAHGPAHWCRVERNGLLLARRTGADEMVVRLFALFHDSRRRNENHDPQHGLRGATFAAELRGTHFELSDEAFAKFTHACAGHTDEHHHDDPTIGTCYDADRLDLGRVGIIPDESYMSTEFGREIARFGNIQPFLVAETSDGEEPQLEP